ncbi:MAG: class C sortase, partial [Ruminococcus sp.]
MKKTILWIIAILLVIASIGIAGYPFISDYVNNLNAVNEVVLYSDTIAAVNHNDYKELLEAAHKYNELLIGSSVITDPFAESNDLTDEYQDMLKVDNTDVMATISIPKINLNLPVYHGTSAEVLKKGVGHLSSSSLPVGGKGTHAILSGHTGNSNLRLFSDVNQIEEGDVFYISCLNEKLAYKVNQIKVILPTETDDLQINPDEDYVTLVTCTPFGVNSHRLLVRGTRISLDDADKIAADKSDAKST